VKFDVVEEERFSSGALAQILVPRGRRERLSQLGG